MTVPVETMKNSCYWNIVWEEIGHLSAVKKMEYVGDLEMEVYDATEGKCPRIFYHNT